MSDKYEIYFAGKLLCHKCNMCDGKGKTDLSPAEAIDRSYGHYNYNRCNHCMETGSMLTEDGHELYRFIRKFNDK